MRKVVEMEDIISVSSLNDLCLIRVEFDNGIKGRVIKISPCDYAIIIPFNNNDYDELIRGNTITDLIRDFSNQAEFYYFEKSEEFKGWLLD